MTQIRIDGVVLIDQPLDQFTDAFLAWLTAHGGEFGGAIEAATPAEAEASDGAGVGADDGQA